MIVKFREEKMNPILKLLNLILTIIIGYYLSILIPDNIFAQDKSGVTPNTISIPSGPGSIEGLGESFEPTLNTGTAKYRVNLTLPPGTAGNNPNLSLNYDGGNSNGILGYGWKLNMPFIQRQSDKGIPRYIDNTNSVDDDGDGEVDEFDEKDRFINELKEELVPTPEGYYFCENEETFIRYRLVGDHWEGIMPDGTLMEFGVTRSARILDTLTGNTYCWNLERMTDTNGNTIIYTYASFPTKKNTNQQYLTKIEYGPGTPPWDNFHFIKFEYEARPDWFEDCRGGFIVRTGMRLKEIVIGTQGPTLIGHASSDFNGDGITDYLNRKYQLRYEAHPHWSLLTSVTWIGADIISTFPPLAFSYTVSNPSTRISADGQIIGSLNTPNQVMDNQLVDLVDLNGDGLPDIIKTEEYGGTHTAYLNQGEKDVNGNKVIEWGVAASVSSTDGFAWNIDLKNSTDAIAHLADMDGDGLADLVYKSSIGEVYYFRNNASIGWGPRLQMNNDPTSSSPPSPFGESNVKTADLDFDKRIDIIQSIDVGGSVDYRIWLNLGGQRYSKSKTVGQNSGFMLSSVGVHIADFNGDRVPDILKIRPKELEVTAGLGYGQFTAVMTVPLTDYTLSDEEIKKARLEDISGDGLVDLVIERAQPGQLWYWINQGNYTLSNKKIITGMPSTYGTNTEVRWADINGNGTTDLIYSDSHSEPRIQIIDVGNLMGCVPNPNMLICIDNGIGRKSIIEYATSTRFLLDDKIKGFIWPNPLPFPVDVVSKVSDNDGLGNEYATQFYYHDGYYDGEEKEFRGFAQVEKREIGDSTAPDLIMAYQFEIGILEEALKGKPIVVEARDAKGGIFYCETNSWKTRKLQLNILDDERKVTFPFRENRIKEVIEKGIGSLVKLKWEYEYDNFGNLTRQLEWGRLDNGWDDERITDISYTSNYPSGKSRWIINKEVEKSVTDEDGTLFARKRNYYDKNIDLGNIDIGRLTRIEDWVSDNKWVVSLRNDFDDYGNVVAIYDALYGEKPGHFRELIYDSLFYSFPVEEIIYTGELNPYSLRFSANYDYGFGVVSSSMECNGYKTFYNYDPFSRLTSITKPLDRKPSTEYEYVLNVETDNGKVVNWIETRQLDESDGDGSLHSRTYFDGLGRELMTRAEGESNEQVVVTNRKTYNARKLPHKKFLPYFDSGSLAYTEPVLNIGYTEHFYDALGREIRINQPQGPEGTLFSKTIYEPLGYTFYDEEQTNENSPYYGCGKIFVQDGLLDENNNNRIRKLYQLVKLTDKGEELDSLVKWETSYACNVLGNTTRYTDYQGNQKILLYDGLGRNIFLNDPNRGYISYEYDNASNLIRQVNAKDQTLEYNYDGLNRLISEHSLGVGVEPEVKYHYDIPIDSLDKGDLWKSSEYEDKFNRGRNILGYLSWVEDESGEEHISYDERGRVEWIIKRIHDSDKNDLRNFYTCSEYDHLDRITKLTYPDNTHISYTYNDRGLIKSISNVIIECNYNTEAKIEMLQLACGVTSDYSFDHRLRLNRIHTFRNSDNLVLQDLNYSYDGVSNIIHIHDARTDAQLQQIGIELGIDTSVVKEFNVTDTFKYDSRYRLVEAYNTSIYGKIKFKYDRIGNMVSKKASLSNSDYMMNLGIMSFGGELGTVGRNGRNPGEAPGPNAITRTEISPLGPLNFSYDANGNILTDRHMKFTWDYKDRLTDILGDSLNAHYYYDYSGQRKKKIVKSLYETTTENITKYIDKFSEIRNGILLKYAYFENKRIAIYNNTETHSDKFLTSAFYLADHLGSTVLIVSDSAKVLGQMVYYPYGTLRKEINKNRTGVYNYYKYTGKELDDESGNYYFEARYYNSFLGSFLGADKILEELPYSYAECNPLIYNDLSGNDANYYDDLDNDISYPSPTDVQQEITQTVSDIGNSNTIVGVALVWKELGRLPYEAIFGGGGAGLSTVMGVGSTLVGLGTATLQLTARLTGVDLGCFGKVASYLGDAATAVGSASVAMELGQLPLSAIYGSWGVGATTASTVLGTSVAVVGSGVVGFSVGNLIESGLDVSSYSSSVGNALFEKLKDVGFNENISFLGGVVISTQAIPFTIPYAITEKAMKFFK